MYAKYFKRFLDICFSSLCLPFVLILIIIFGPIIYLNDPGPIFYNAIRRGKNGNTFRMYKFRSMYVNAPDIRNNDGSTFNSSKDARVTAIGRILRKTSIDELLQIVNVFKGDMSFIGPRPTLPSMPYDELDKTRKDRLKVRPGITGYSQAYYRNSIAQADKYRYDLFYVEHVSFWLDCKILFKTISTVFRRENVFVEK